MSPSPTATTSLLRLVSALPALDVKQPAQPPRDQRVQFVIDTMTAHLKQPHTLSTLAALIELCPRQLERLFKEETGTSPLHYLHDLRLARACDLLVTGFKNVTEIAEAVGFEDVNYFIRVFKVAHGCTPLTFRRRSAGERVRKKIA
jgi:transcriptional regulator GlxA family with amidase domain